jgi:DNA-binding PadR family transcriptional regulator
VFGHCYTSTGCLYKIFGYKNVKMYRGSEGEIYYWWNRDNNEKIIDITAKQYNKKINFSFF